MVGDAANMVARLEDLAGDNQILLSPATYDRVKDYVLVSAWEPRHVTGFSEPVCIYELVQTKDNLVATMAPVESSDIPIQQNAVNAGP